MASAYVLAYLVPTLLACWLGKDQGSRACLTSTSLDAVLAQGLWIFTVEFCSFKKDLLKMGQIFVLRALWQICVTDIKNLFD